MKISLLVLIVLTLFSKDILASTKLEALGSFQRRTSMQYNDIWGYTDQTGREYAILGGTTGVSFIDVTEPSQLKEIAFFPGPKSTWRDMKTFSHYAYVVNETSGGMEIYDLSQLPAKVTLAATYRGFSTSHNIWIDTERALLFAEGNMSMPVRILSLANPIAPVELSTFGVECHDIYARGGLVYVSEGGHGTIGIYNYDDPRNPRLVSRFEIENAGYVHNAWPSEDGNFLMTTEENSGKTMKYFDISDLSNVTTASEVLAPGALAHNTHIKGNFAYVSHYGSGLRIYDLAKPDQVSEVAFWQKTAQPQRGFVSAWGAYPFFKSGKILISDIESGLYVVWHESALEN